MTVTEDWTNGEIVRTLTRIETKQDDSDRKADQFRDELRANYVHRGEFAEHKDHVNEKFEAIESRRAPWWSTAMVVIATLSLVLSVVIVLL